MKKILLILIAILGFTCNIYSQEKYTYQVTITTQVNYAYYDNDYNLVGESSAPGVPQVITVQARTPEEARRMALDECSTMCERKSRKDEGKRKYGNGTYQCYSTVEPYEVKAVLKK